MKHFFPRNAFVGLVLATILCPSRTGIRAQIRASELGSMSQTIDGTRVAMEYFRPQMRGRDSLFGMRDMKWGRVWTPGANYATTLDVSKSIKLDGHTIPKGKYSVWFVLNSATNWTFFLDKTARRFHENRPDSAQAVVRFSVPVEAAPVTDMLSWSVPAVRRDGATLVFQWERARVAMNIEVEPSLVMTLSAADAVPYVGQYSYTELGEKGKPARTIKFTVTHEDGTLKGQWDPDDSYFKKFALVRVAPDWFAPGVYDKNGVIYEVLRPEFTFEFTRVGGRATALKARDEKDEVFATAKRVP